MHILGYLASEFTPLKLAELLMVLLCGAYASTGLLVTCLVGTAADRSTPSMAAKAWRACCRGFVRPTESRWSRSPSHGNSWSPDHEKRAQAAKSRPGPMPFEALLTSISTIITSSPAPKSGRIAAGSSPFQHGPEAYMV
jgi:hypothetical protein